MFDSNKEGTVTSGCASCGYEKVKGHIWQILGKTCENKSERECSCECFNAFPGTFQDYYTHILKMKQT